MREQARNPGWHVEPSVSLTADFFANPRYPPSASAAAPSLDPVAVSGEDRSMNSPSAGGEEVALPTEAVLSTGPPTELSFKFMRLVLVFVVPNNLLFSFGFLLIYVLVFILNTYM